MLSVFGDGSGKGCLGDAATQSSAAVLHNPGPIKGQVLKSIITDLSVGEDHPWLEETFRVRTRPSDAYYLLSAIQTKHPSSGTEIS